MHTCAYGGSKYSVQRTRRRCKIEGDKEYEERRYVESDLHFERDKNIDRFT